jgi:hypothetical protein
MQSEATRSGSEHVSSVLSVLGSFSGLVLLALGAALLARELFNLLDQEIRWWSLLQGAVIAGLGVATFARSSRGWSSGGARAPTPWERVGRTVVAIVAVGAAIVAFAALGVLIAGPVSDLQRFEDSCFEMDSILCGLQGAIGGAVAGLAFGIRVAIGVMRGVWMPVAVLLVAVLGLAAWFAVGPT